MEDKCVWFDGKNVYEVSFCNEFLSENPIKYVDGVFYNKNGAVDVRIIEKKIADKLLAQQVQKNFDKKVTALTGALKRICYSHDFEDNSSEIHLKNGMLKEDGTFVPEFRICRNRLNATYNPNAPKPIRWISFLNELLEPADILTLQEYIGYCLIHSTKGQSMLFIVGNGGEGKSRIGVVLYHIFKEAAYFGSITELAGDKFLKSNLVGKMLLIDDDMNMEGLKDTSFLKSLATSETPITVQAKGKQGIQVKLSCRTICFSNSMPKSLYDKSEGWERRLMILSTKPVPKDRVNDPFLSEKLIAESEGIFLWALEGLKRLIANNFKFTVSERAKQNIAEMKESNCNIISFLKDEQLIKFGDGFECATADLYSGYCYDVNGKQVVQTKTWRPPENMTERQIKKELDRQVVLFEEECKRGQVTAAIKFETFADQWFDEYAILNLRKSTYTLLKFLTKRVYPAIGHLRIDKITSRDIQRFVNDLLTNGRNKQSGKPLARKTVLLHLSFISNIFRYAIKMGMLVDNPASRVTVAKQEKKEKQIYTIDEMKQLFKCLENAPLKYRVFVTLDVYSGYRRGEMLGLEWKDIDWDNGVISVRRTSNYTKLYGMFTDTTKTKKSQRSTKYPAVVINLLRELKAEQDKQREILGDKWVESDRLFVTDDGTPLFVNNPYKWLQKFCKDNNPRFCYVHSYRHFHASALIFAGVDPVTVSADLGHSAVSTTTSVYCHLFQEAQARTSSVISQVLDFDDDKKDTMKPSA